jgi:OFA family oxalate/formate antiporter-like MFS transporter
MKKIFYGWWIVGACFLIGFYVGGVVFYGFTAFFEPIRREFGWSYTQISLAASLRGMEMGLFAPIVGFLVDRFGSRTLILVGTIVVGFGLILLSLTQSLAMFYGSFLIIAFGAGGCALVVIMSVVVNWFRKKVSIALGVMMSGIGASGLLVTLIVHLIDGYGWRTTLVVLGVGMWVLGIPLSFLIRDRPEQHGYLPDGETSGEPLSSTDTHGEEREVSIREAFGKSTFWYLNIIEAIRMLTVGTVIIHVMPYLSSIGVPRATAGIIAGAIPLFSIMGRFGFGWLGDVIDKRYVMAITYGLISLGMLVFCNVRAVWFTLLFLVIFPPGYGGGIVLRGAIMREYFGRNSFGKILGVTYGSGAIGGIIGPTLAGWAFDTLGNYHCVWLAFCGLNALALWLIMKMRQSGDG